MANVNGVKDKFATPFGVNPATHSHSQNESWLSSIISSLTSLINGKAAANHTHTANQVRWNTQESPSGYYDLSVMMTSLTAKNTEQDTAIAGKAPSSHTHTKSQITDFAHTHSIANVDGLQTALEGKAPLNNPSFTGNVNIGGGLTVGSGAIHGNGDDESLYLATLSESAYIDLTEDEGSGAIEIDAATVKGRAVADTATKLAAGGAKIPTAGVVKTALDGKVSNELHEIIAGPGAGRQNLNELNCGDTYIVANPSNYQLDELLMCNEGQHIYYHQNAGSNTSTAILIRVYRYTTSQVDNFFVEIAGVVNE